MFNRFFFIDENHLCVCVGDVSGKGVPAALYMAVTLALIRAVAKDHRSTASIVTRLNDELCEHNKEAMFVTLFAGIIDLSSGNFTYTNAGHNPSYFVKVDDDPKPLEEIHGIPLGIFPGKQYDQCVIHLDKGNFIFAYTDGVTDSRNEKKEMFGNDRLVEQLLSNKKNSTKTIIENIFNNTTMFRGNAEQYDDTTVIALKYKGDDS